MTITATREARIAADRMWQVISSPGYLERCHPFCARNPVQHWAADDARDTIHYYGGRIVHRRFTAWHEGSGYDLVVVDDRDVEQAQVRWRIEPTGESTCRLTLKLNIRFLDRLAAASRWAFYRLVARPRMQRYLDAVVSGVVFHAETGQPVVRNQFGSHRWFSPRVG